MFYHFVILEIDDMTTIFINYTRKQDILINKQHDLLQTLTKIIGQCKLLELIDYVCNIINRMSTYVMLSYKLIGT